MDIFVFAVSIFFFLCSWRKERVWHNPYVIFNLLWICVTGLIVIGNEYVYKPNTISLLCVLIGIVAFNLSSLSPRLVIGRLFNYDENIEYCLNIKTATVISIFVVIFSVIAAASAVQAFINGVSFSDIRTDYYTYSGNESVIMYYFRNYVLSPLRYVVIISTIISIFQTEKKSKLLFFNTIIIVILQAVTSGGRYVLMNTIFMFLCGFFLFGAFKKMSIKKKITLGISIVLFGYMIVFLTNDRSTFLAQNMTTLERLYLTIYQYFAGSVTFFGKVFEEYPQIVGSTFGINFACGFIDPIFVVLTFLHILPHPEIFNVIGNYVCDSLMIGPYTAYNAMPTIFGYFYIDGGVVAVFLEAWLFGYLCKRLFSRSQEGNLLYSAFYILMFVQICNSSTRWFLYSSDFCLAFLFLRLIFNKRST